MTRSVKIKKGLDIPLGGGLTGAAPRTVNAGTYAVAPDDYPGYTWKSVVKPGDKVLKGSPLMVAKEDAGLHLVSPVAGEVDEINRGERRKIMYVSVKESAGGGSVAPGEAKTSGELLALLKEAGLFALMRQRPFDTVPLPGAEPRDIFVTAFDTAPLAAPVLQSGMASYLEAGLKALGRLTKGKVYLSVAKGSGLASSAAETVEFEGPHPAGNVGTQIAAIAPVNKGETVWTLDARTAVRIGRLVSGNGLDMAAEVAVTGDDVKQPYIALTSIGASLAPLLEGNLETARKVRVISGNVLTGVREDAKTGFLRWPYRQVTAIDEGDDADEFMGWASLNPGKYSTKRTFPAFLSGLSKPFRFDARIKGGHRAMILSGEYDKVFPMDIYPEYLLKAIMAKDIEKMEQLGIYEVAPEDFALPEFVDTSKIELQKIVRDGLDYLRRETI